MAHTIFNIQEINFDFTYDGPYDILHNERKRKEIYIRNEDKPLLLQLPSLLLNDDYIDGSNGIILPLVTKGNTQNEELKTFLSTLDKKVLETIKINLKRWNLQFTKPSYRALVRVIENNVDKIYENGVMRLDFNSGITKIYDHNKNIIPEEKYKNVLTKGCYLKSIVEIVGIVIEENVISIKMVTHQIGITYAVPKQIILSEYSFIDTDEEDEEPEIEQDMTQLLGSSLNEELTDNKSSEEHDVRITCNSDSSEGIDIPDNTSA